MLDEPGADAVLVIQMLTRKLANFILVFKFFKADLTILRFDDVGAVDHS